MKLLEGTVKEHEECFVSNLDRRRRAPQQGVLLAPENSDTVYNSMPMVKDALSLVGTKQFQDEVRIAIAKGFTVGGRVRRREYGSYSKPMTGKLVGFVYEAKSPESIAVVEWEYRGIGGGYRFNYKLDELDPIK
jgi:hypothetical protein